MAFRKFSLQSCYKLVKIFCSIIKPAMYFYHDLDIYFYKGQLARFLSHVILYTILSCFRSDKLCICVTRPGYIDLHLHCVGIEMHFFLRSLVSKVSHRNRDQCFFRSSLVGILGDWV